MSLESLQPPAQTDRPEVPVVSRLTVEASAEESRAPVVVAAVVAVPAFVPFLILTVIASSVVPPTAHAATRDQDLDHSISRQGVMAYRQQDYPKAVALFNRAIEVYGKKMNAEQLATTYFNISVCQKLNNHIKDADIASAKAENIFAENGVDNPALKIRILRNKTDLCERRSDFEKAIVSQTEVCKLYEENIGRMVVGNFSETGRLHHLELRARHYKKCVAMGQELLARLDKFRMPAESDLEIRVTLTQGIALIFAGDATRGCELLQKLYEPAMASNSADMAAYAAAWLVHYATTNSNEQKKGYWMNKLSTAAERCNTVPQFWLHRIEIEHLNGPN